MELSAAKYKKIFFLHDDDVHNVQNAGDQIKTQMHAAFSEFYAWIEYQSDLERFFPDAVLDKIAEQEQYIWQDLIMAQVNDDYVARQRFQVKQLEKMGVPFEAYLTTLLALHEIIENIFVKFNLGSFALLRSFKKIAGINICIVIDTYNEALNETMKKQHAVIMEMSTPVTQLWHSILFLPLIGFIDAARSENILMAVLKKIAQTQSKVFILDISGIATMDTAVANYIIKMSKATKLMGCFCIISGISPLVAQTIVGLGISAEDMFTTGNLQGALQKSFEMTGARIVAQN